MDQKVTVVALTENRRYDSDEIKKNIEKSSAAIGFSQRFHGTRVLLKPNLISGRGPVYACTDLAVIIAAAEWFIDHGAFVSLGDSPAFGGCTQVLRRHGMESALTRLGVHITEFKTPVIRKLSNHVSVGIAAEALTCDLLVNLPKIKAHNQMFMTMAVKNLFGIVCGMRKALIHMKNGTSHERFAEVMLDLAEIVPPSIVIADGIEVMHRQGPVGGDRLHLGCIAMGCDPVSVDSAMLDALELEPERCPIWRSAARRKHPGSDLSALTYPLDHPSIFHGSGFIAPQILNPVPFNPLRFMVSSFRRVLLRMCR